jgi:hypothetical protein
MPAKVEIGLLSGLLAARIRLAMPIAAALIGERFCLHHHANRG